ncbi:MAG TPA: Hsp20 family protein [Rhizomicrobium sp.]|jgi:HSP20 family molecular chaperone IbpA|nr:Hsp20 family protein [Rhizomicrobium sp.]
MNRNSAFGSPFLLGFDHLEQLIERTAKSAGESYPPCNIETLAAGKLRITLAVAGFGGDELSVTLEDRQLIVRGRQSESGERTFMYRGIAARPFERVFVLAEGIEVTGATLEHGMLFIELARPNLESVVRKIDIKCNADTKNAERDRKETRYG